MGIKGAAQNGVVRRGGYYVCTADQGDLIGAFDDTGLVDGGFKECGV